MMQSVRVFTCGIQAHLRETRCRQSICLHIGGRATLEGVAASTWQPICNISEVLLHQSVSIYG